MPPLTITTNKQGDTEKVIQASSERLYSMVLVDKKHVWVAGKDRVIRVFNASKYKKEKELLSHQAMVRCLQVIEHPERGNQVWSADVAGRIIIWDPQVRLLLPFSMAVWLSSHTEEKRLTFITSPPT